MFPASPRILESGWGTCANRLVCRDAAEAFVPRFGRPNVDAVRAHGRSRQPQSATRSEGRGGWAVARLRIGLGPRLRAVPVPSACLDWVPASSKAKDGPPNGTGRPPRLAPPCSRCVPGPPIRCRAVTGLPARRPGRGSWLVPGVTHRHVEPCPSTAARDEVRGQVVFARVPPRRRTAAWHRYHGAGDSRRWPAGARRS